MLKDAPLIAFIATRDAARAKSFYGDVLGLRLLAEEPFALVFDAGGTMLRVTPVRELKPASHTVLGWQVGDIDKAMAALIKQGVHFERFDALEQDAQGAWTSPGGATVAWLRDPDGNLLSLTQRPSLRTTQ